jgi:hypothetical protein
MDLQAIRAALVDACHDQGLNLYHDVPTTPELPCLYAGMPVQMYDWSSSGSCTIDIALTLCVSRSDEEVAQPQLSDFISTMQIPNAILNVSPRMQWVDVAFITIDNFRAASFGETTQVLACDFNFQLRSKQ